MTKWERFGEDTWINTDHVEVVRVEEQEDGRWQLTAAFTSGRTHPIGSHDDRELLADCTDALLRGQVGERLLDLAGAEVPIDEVAATDPVPVEAPVEAPFEVVATARRRRWFHRPVAPSL